MDHLRARELRKQLTEAEKALWRHLRLRQIGGYKFRRQQPLGPYVVDFVCFEKQLIVELDGGHHSEQLAYDADRTAWLGSQGYRVLRFWNHQVLGEIEAVNEVIYEALLGAYPPPWPSPTRGEGIQ
ncbi:MAG: endonuclease domain-containing protein [candidate division NC10 bacterium]|nr:endonuclease domain-containing protein [candidate division NC10 bacterium]